jgi:hypothetical protein
VVGLAHLQAEAAVRYVMAHFWLQILGMILSSAFSAFKGLEPIPQTKGTATPGEFLEARFSQSPNRSKPRRGENLPPFPTSNSTLL